MFWFHDQELFIPPAGHQLFQYADAARDMAYSALGQSSIPLHLAQMGGGIAVIGSGVDDIDMGKPIKPVVEKRPALGFSMALAKAFFHTFKGNISGIRFPEIKMALLF